MCTQTHSHEVDILLHTPGLQSLCQHIMMVRSCRCGLEGACLIQVRAVLSDMHGGFVSGCTDRHCLAPHSSHHDHTAASVHTAATKLHLSLESDCRSDPPTHTPLSSTYLKLGCPSLLQLATAMALGSSHTCTCAQSIGQTRSKREGGVSLPCLPVCLHWRPCHS
jgi:hypothetical protein